MNESTVALPLCDAVRELWMGYNISIKDSAVLVAYVGHVTLGERGRAIEALQPVLRQSGFKRVLVDFRDAVVIPAADDQSSQDYLSVLFAAPQLQGCCIAMVGLAPEQIQLDECACAARALAIRRFDTDADAREWLLKCA